MSFAGVTGNDPPADRWLGPRSKTGAAGADVRRVADGAGGYALRLHRRRPGDAALNTFQVATWLYTAEAAGLVWQAVAFSCEVRAGAEGTLPRFGPP